MIVPFSPERTIQATAVILNTTPSRAMSRRKLLNLLYIADREYLRACGKSITGDYAVATEQGPMLSRTDEMSQESGEHKDLWCQFFKWAAPLNITLLSDPGVDDLSQKQINKLADVARRFEAMDDKNVSDYTHTFAEWIKNKPGSGTCCTNIPLDDIFEAAGLLEHKEHLLAEERAFTAFKQLLSEPLSV